MPRPIEKKYIPEKLYFMLPIEKPEIPERVSNFAKEEGLYEKEHCHVSVVVEGSAVAIRDGIAKCENPAKAQEEIVKLFNDLTWEYNLTDKYSYQEKFYDKDILLTRGITDEPEHMRRSIVQVLEMPDMEIFYNKVSEILNVKLNIPIPHVTIFGWSDYLAKKDRGIGISSKEDFEEYNKRYI